MKYKVGDKVRVRADLQGDETYGGMYPVLGMAGFAGKVVTIKGFCQDGRCYHIAEHKAEKEVQWWTDEMFEGLAEAAPEPQPEPLDTGWSWEDLF